MKHLIPMILALFLLAAGSTLAATYGVYPDGSGTYPTIQAAVNACVDGDRVVLMPGTYTGSGNTDVVVWRNITIRANDGLGSVIIDCEQTPRAFVLEYSDAVIEGLIIRNGAYTRGGAVSIEAGSPTFTDCTFEDNTATSQGGAMDIFSEAHVTLNHCAFARNHCDGQGGAICVREWSTLDISRGTFVVNGANEGGHISLLEESDLDVDTSILAYAYGGRAVMGYYHGSTTISCTDVYGNRGGDWVDALAGLMGSDNYEVAPMFIDAVGGDYRLHPLSEAWMPGSCGAIGSAYAVAGVDEEVLYGLRPAGRGMFRDLETAMAEVPAGAVIVLDDGTYEGAGYRNLDPENKAMTIGSRSGDPDACILDADCQVPVFGRVFSLGSDVGFDFSVRGLGLTGGHTIGNGGLVSIGAGAAPLFEDCAFMLGFATEGGNVSIFGTADDLAAAEFLGCRFQKEVHAEYYLPSFEDCLFSGSDASLEMINCGSGIIRNGLFQDQIAPYGGAIRMADGTGTTRIYNTDFLNCQASGINGDSMDGGAIHLDGAGNVILTECHFQGCKADSAGSDIFALGSQSLDFLTLEGCQFQGSGNMTHGSGGSISAVEYPVNFSDCHWDGYSVEKYGGAIYLRLSDGSISDCRIENCTAFIGGGISTYYSQNQFQDCLFLENRADLGGAMRTFQSDLQASFCVFEKNEAESSGGAVFSYGGFVNEAISYDHSIFLGNSCQNKGAAICLSAGGPDLDLSYCTFYANEDLAESGFGGQISVTNLSHITLDNSVISHSATAAPITEVMDDSWVTATCTNIFGNTMGNWTGMLEGQLGLDDNISLNPQYCDPDIGELHVNSASPCLPENNACQTQIGALGQGCDLPSATPDTPVLVSSPMLGGIHPNPFNPQTTISYELPQETAVTLVVHDVSGRVVRTLRGGVVESAGNHDVVWNGSDDAGRQVGSGVYLVRLTADGVSQVQRVALIK